MVENFILQLCWRVAIKKKFSFAKTDIYIHEWNGTRVKTKNIFYCFFTEASPLQRPQREMAAV